MTVLAYGFITRPDCNSGKDPFYCNDSYPFIESQIKVGVLIIFTFNA